MREAATIFIALVSACLMLANLDNFTLWHDEGTNALMAASLARDGALSGWDGRNLFYGVHSGNRFGITDDLNFAYPPWPAIPSALGLLLFGDGEFALRFPHALLGALCLPVFWLLLRMNFPARSRLRFFAFALFALSPIVILYMRQGRYYPDAILFTLLSFYCYQRFWRDGGAGWLAGMSVFTVLNFLNHFAVGLAFAAAVSSWHLIFYARETSRRQWILFAATGAATAAVCGAYLFLAGIVGGESTLEYGEELYKHSWVKRRFWLIYLYARDIVRAGWLPLWIALWWAWYAFRRPPAPRRSGKRKSESARAAAAAEIESERQIRRWGVLGLLTIFFVIMTSVTPVGSHNAFSDMRYMISVLPILALLVAVCVDWLWTKEKIAGGVLFAVLVFSNFAGFPFIVQGALCKGNFNAKYLAETKSPLLALAGEVYRDHSTGIGEAVSYLNAHAAQDDTIVVHPPSDSAVMLSYLSDKLIFCCGLSPDAKLPKEKIRALGAPVYQGDAEPKWMVRMQGSETPPDGYTMVYVGEAVSYPVHRPELEFHCFGESRLALRTRIFRRNEE